MARVDLENRSVQPISLSKASLLDGSWSWARMKPGSGSGEEVDTSTTPGSATAAAKRCSKARARGTQ